MHKVLKQPHSLPPWISSQSTTRSQTDVPTIHLTSHAMYLRLSTSHNFTWLKQPLAVEHCFTTVPALAPDLQLTLCCIFTKHTQCSFQTNKAAPLYSRSPLPAGHGNQCLGCIVRVILAVIANSCSQLFQFARDTPHFLSILPVLWLRK